MNCSICRAVAATTPPVPGHRDPGGQRAERADGGSFNLIGTLTTANLYYVFQAGFTVSSGATLNVAANVDVQLFSGLTLTDNGTVNFASGDTMTLYGSFSTQQIVVGSGGLLTAAGTTFNSFGSSITSLIVVNAGGHLQASNSTFSSSLSQVNLNTGSILNAGDLTGNSFNCPLFVPENELQYLSGSGSNNAQFQAIEIQAGNVPSGQTVALNLIGTLTTANLYYVFQAGFTVSSGATLNVAANVDVQLFSGLTLTDNGTVNFASSDTMTLYGSFSTQQIVVGSGGLLTAAGTTFNRLTGSSITSLIVVNAGGHLQASNSTFSSSLSQVNLNTGSILNAGDLTGNNFNCPLFVPENELRVSVGRVAATTTQSSRPSRSRRATCRAGQTVAANLIGTLTTANLYYVFQAGFTVSSGATLNVAANVDVQLVPVG